MKAQYIRAMDALHRACEILAGVCLVIITLIIPYGVFCRYVLNSAASWPEPMAVLLMIVLSFLSAVVCYREHMHIGVGMLPSALSGVPRMLLGVVLELAMLSTNLFLLWYGIRLVQKTWYQSMRTLPMLNQHDLHAKHSLPECPQMRFHGKRNEWRQLCDTGCLDRPDCGSRNSHWAR